MARTPILHSLSALTHWLRAGIAQPGGLGLKLFLTCLWRGDLLWPRRVQPWVCGQRVLDVGCGRNLQSVGFLAVGACSYTGLDPTLDLDRTEMKDSRKRWSERSETGISPRAVMMGRPAITYVRATLHDFAETAPKRFDVIVMHNVTEHLMAIEEDFACFAKLLRPGGAIVFRHPNYYCWHGHHRSPRTIREILPGDPEQASVVDWAHVRPRPEHAWIQKTQNRITLDALRALVARHFTIERWDEDESPREQGIERLTPEILARYPEFTRRELATKCAFVVARKPADANAAP